MTVISLDDTSVQVTWVRLSSQDIVDYRVYFALTDDTSSLERRQETEGERVVTVPAQANSTRVEGLVEGAQYRFQVVGVVIVNGLEHDGERSNGLTLLVGGVRGESSINLRVGLLLFFFPPLPCLDLAFPSYRHHLLLSLPLLSTSESSGGLAPSVIAGIVIGVVVLILCLLFLLCCIVLLW